MDTRFWGPCGWILLHNVVANYPKKPNQLTKKKYKDFFETLPYVLPCIYCRRSLTQYYLELPLDDKWLSTRENLMEWLYHIHNKVNDKLRGQGLLNYDNPDFKEIKKKYSKKNSCLIKKCWNFLYSIAINYPENKGNINLRLKHNYYIFFFYLIQLFPNNDVSKKMKKFSQEYNLNNFLDNRKTLFKWLYGIEKVIDKNCQCYENRVKTTSKYIASCKGIKGEKPTCRIKYFIEPS